MTTSRSLERRSGFALACASVLLVSTPCALGQNRSETQYWDADHTVRELADDCGCYGRARDVNKCLFFIRTVAQSSFWFDKCIPFGTSLTEISDLTLKFVEENRQYTNAAATNIVLAAMHMKWKCR
jgi:hypothetical protein